MEDKFKKGKINCKINSMSLVSFLDYQQNCHCQCTLLSIPLEKKPFSANSEIRCENRRNTKVGCTIATSRTVSHLSLWMHIAVNRSEKKRVREK